MGVGQRQVTSCKPLTRLRMVTHTMGYMSAWTHQLKLSVQLFVHDLQHLCVMGASVLAKPHIMARIT